MANHNTPKTNAQFKSYIKQKSSTVTASTETAATITPQRQNREVGKAR